MQPTKRSNRLLLLAVLLASAPMMASAESRHVTGATGPSTANAPLAFQIAD